MKQPIIEPGTLLLRKQGHDVLMLVEEVNGDMISIRVIKVPPGNQSFKFDEVIEYTLDSIYHFIRYGTVEKLA